MSSLQQGPPGPPNQLVDDAQLKLLLLKGDSLFWPQLLMRSRVSEVFSDLFFLSTLRKKALARHFDAPSLLPTQPLRLAMLGGVSLYPLQDLVEHLLSMHRFSCEIFTGKYDGFVSEIMEEGSELYQFKPQIVFLLPSLLRCKYLGRLTDPIEKQRDESRRTCEEILSLCRLLHERSGAEIILGNYMLPADLDPGPFRTRTLASDWNFRKSVNLEIGLQAPPFVHICDLEFISARRGTLNSHDNRAWFESKQPGTADLLVDIAKEINHLVNSLKQSPKKVLVLDLDNTLWGGVVADDGLEGIEIGDTSPRGEAFKAFQKYVRSLIDRGIVLAVCSKNEHQIAAEVFAKHPEMVLKMEDFVSFKANWNPKSDNIKAISEELGLGLDSFVFADDNPAEIEIVRQFLPQVCPVLLGPDPAYYVAQLQSGRFFEPKGITDEDGERTTQYRQEVKRKELFSSVTDMDAYLKSLQIQGAIKEFDPVDVPRLVQLINRSNQFNFTTLRRTEAEIETLMKSREHCSFSMRLADRFGDYGLISIVIGKILGPVFEIDTWVMSCRVLKRQVEDEIMNEIFRLAATVGCARVRGVYVPTAKNGMVAEIYPTFGFTLTKTEDKRKEFEQEVKAFQKRTTQIQIIRRVHDTH